MPRVPTPARRIAGMALRQWCGGGGANKRMGRRAARPIGCAAPALPRLCGGRATGDSTDVRGSACTSSNTRTVPRHRPRPISGSAMAGAGSHLSGAPPAMHRVPVCRPGLRGALRHRHAAVDGVQQRQPLNERTNDGKSKARADPWHGHPSAHRGRRHGRAARYRDPGRLARCRGRGAATGERGDAQARAWLAQYLVGKASASAPTALTVQVNQWSGKDPLAERLARPLIQGEKFPELAGSDAREAAIQDAITTELVRKLPSAETTAKPALARVCGEFGDETISNFPDDLGKYFELRKTGRDNSARTTRDNERSRA